MKTEQCRTHSDAISMEKSAEMFKIKQGQHLCAMLITHADTDLSSSLTWPPPLKQAGASLH
jgi:hypothetical protein